MNVMNIGGKVDDEIPELKVYKQRWVVLGVFVIFTASNTLQWVQYSMPENVSAKYYNISTTPLNWTSLVDWILLILFIPFLLHTSYLLDKWGLRMMVTISAISNCTGAWLKLISVNPTLFWLGLLGKTFVFLSQLCVLSIPPRLAAVWFDCSEVSSACSLGTVGNHLGFAISFLFPPVTEAEDLESIHQKLYLYFLILAGISSISLGLILLFFKDAPGLPPSHAQARAISRSIDFLGSLKRLTLNSSYLLLFFSYGIIMGTFLAITTLLGQMISTHYENVEQYTWNISMIIVLSGIVGSVICGIILDKFRKYKGTALMLYILSLLSVTLLTIIISRGIFIVYLVSAFIGFSMTSMIPVGYELAAELTYPEPEGTSSGLLIVFAKVAEIVLTNVFSFILFKLDDVYVNSCMCFGLAAGVILTACIKPDFRRQEAEKRST